jgi:hypothetical protein
VYVCRKRLKYINVQLLSEYFHVYATGTAGWLRRLHTFVTAGAVFDLLPLDCGSATQYRPAPERKRLITCIFSLSCDRRFYWNYRRGRRGRVREVTHKKTSAASVGVSPRTPYH